MGNNNSIIKLKDVKLHFPVKKGFLTTKRLVKAVDGVSFSIEQGETFGLVGESGCGKTTLGKTLLRLYDITSGSIFFEDTDITRLNQKEFMSFRKKINLIFQDPNACLNPRLKVKDLITEPLKFQNLGLSRTEIEERVDKVLDDVKLRREYKNRYPHEFSGGQQQRIGLARALILKPKFIVCDEPVSALDVSVQAQIINLLNQLQDEYNLTYLFISHDLSVVKFISKRLGIMYLGKIVELGESDIIFKSPAHPYTESLLSAIPVPDPRSKKKRIILEGEVPSPLNVPKGCRFHTRCKYATDICRKEVPKLVERERGRFLACFHPLV